MGEGNSSTAACRSPRVHVDLPGRQDGSSSIPHHDGLEGLSSAAACRSPRVHNCAVAPDLQVATSMALAQVMPSPLPTNRLSLPLQQQGQHNHGCCSATVP